jgi:general secretion pathway protein G
VGWRSSPGFTLVELLVVLAILGLLAAIATPQLIKHLGTAKRDSARVQVEQLSTILDLYHLEVGNYPAQEEGLRALVEQPPSATNWNGPYLKKAESLTDPWGREYLYRFPGELSPNLGDGRGQAAA